MNILKLELFHQISRHIRNNNVKCNRILNDKLRKDVIVQLINLPQNINVNSDVYNYTIEQQHYC